MLASAVISFLAGASIGMRLRAVALAALLPAGIALCAAFASAGLIEAGPWPLLTAWIALQVGYFAGAALDTGLLPAAPAPPPAGR